MPKAKTVKAKVAPGPAAKSYDFKDELMLRPDVGLQAQFRQKKPPAKYRYDPSLNPQLSWDVNADRERAESLLRAIGEAADAAAKGDQAAAERAKQAAAELRKLSQPFLNWAGKAEHQDLEVPTLPLFVHERLSTEAILKSVEGRKPQKTLLSFFGDSELDVTDRVLKAYTHKGRWTNRIVLGDSLVVMNSLLRYEGLSGQVQVVYFDPPYGVSYGSNFQPFIRKRTVDHNKDDSLIREPEMVQAYRDTWDVGLHSYLTYLRDRFLLARELLHQSGSIFVQIGEENVHVVRNLLDEIFGHDNSVALIPFRKKTMPLGARHLESVTDYLLWYARDFDRMKFRPLHESMQTEGDSHWNYVELPDGTRRKMSRDEINNHKLLPTGSVPIQLVSLYPAGVNQTGLFSFEFKGHTYRPPPGNSWFTNEEGMQRLAAASRLMPYEDGETLRYVLKLSDSPVTTITNLWADTSAPADKVYTVQTSTKVVQRCILMTTDSGDLVLDPTCGSGTTAYVAESWGRRWITIDTSRVPLALARQRLITATYPYFKLRDEKLGPAGGFVYARRQNRRGEEVGGIIPYVSKGSIAQGAEPDTEIIVDRPEIDEQIVRVTGGFAVEATVPAPMHADASESQANGQSTDAGDYIPRMLEVLRKSPLLRLPAGKTVEFRNLRAPARALDIHAAADVPNGGPDLKPAAVVFGPENGAVTEQLIVRAVKEANAKNYHQLFVIGFAIQDAATKLLKNSQNVLGMQVTYAQATMDILMGDLLKTTRSSQIFSVTGLPDVELTKMKKRNPEGDELYRIRLLAVDTFDPVTMEPSTLKGDDVPCWMLDSDYDELCFRANQVFFPRTGAWDNLKRALKGSFSDSLWEHLAGTESESFVKGEHGRIAVKVIDDRGNELLVVKDLKEATHE